MHHLIKQFFILSVLILSGLGIQAQETSFSTAITAGPTTPTLDNGLGLHLGVNPAYAISPFLSLEGQLSYLYTFAGTTFLTGEEVNGQAVNILAGGRVYLLSEERKNRLYLNLLLGGNYNREAARDVITSEWNLGFSLGGYLERNRFLIGLSYDTPQNVILKVGYILR